LTGDSAATSTDGAETDSGSAFAAILAPMSVDGARTTADGRQSGAYGAAAAPDRAPAAASGDELLLGNAKDHLSITTLPAEPLADADLKPGPVAATLTAGQDGGNSGKSGKSLPPGGKDAQSLEQTADAAGTIPREMAAADPGIESTAQRSEATSGVPAVAGGNGEAALSPHSAGQPGQQQTASPEHPAAAGTPRNVGMANSGLADAPTNSVTVDGPPDGPAMPESNLSERAVKISAETGSQARSGETANPLAAAGGGLSAEASPMPERGPVTASAELRPVDRPLTDRPGGELVQGDRTPRLVMQQFAGQPGWGEEIQGKLQWLSRGGIHRAELQLHPAELGSIEVRITAEQDQTSVVFVAANRTARELLEAELPRLRELFSQAGMELGQAEVSDRESGDGEFAAREETHDGRHSSTARRGAEAAETPMQEANLLSMGVRGDRGVIDYYI
jgi:flagellar hook-length control protein FliK